MMTLCVIAHHRAEFSCLCFQTALWVAKGLDNSPLPPADRKQAPLEGVDGRSKILDCGLFNSLINSLTCAPV